jgi:hypothetical protein
MLRLDNAEFLSLTETHMAYFGDRYGVRRRIKNFWHLANECLGLYIVQEK